jgi:hypothetical protein
MLTYLRNLLISLLSYLLSQKTLGRLFRRWHGRHFDRLDEKVSDTTLEGLLGAMEVGVKIFPAWRERVRGFRGTIVFTAKSTTNPKREPVHATAIFDGKGMVVRREGATAFNAKVTFSDPLALFSFLLSREHDISEALLKNAVETKGNLNYVYRFGFLVMEMTRWMRAIA